MGVEKPGALQWNRFNSDDMIFTARDIARESFDSVDFVFAKVWLPISLMCNGAARSVSADRTRRGPRPRARVI